MALNWALYPLTGVPPPPAYYDPYYYPYNPYYYYYGYPFRFGGKKRRRKKRRKYHGTKHSSRYKKNYDYDNDDAYEYEYDDDDDDNDEYRDYGRKYQYSKSPIEKEIYDNDDDDYDDYDDESDEEYEQGKLELTGEEAIDILSEEAPNMDIESLKHLNYIMMNAYKDAITEKHEPSISFFSDARNIVQDEIAKHYGLDSIYQLTEEEKFLPHHVFKKTERAISDTREPILYFSEIKNEDDPDKVLDTFMNHSSKWTRHMRSTYNNNNNNNNNSSSRSKKGKINSILFKMYSKGSLSPLLKSDRIHPILEEEEEQEERGELPHNIHLNTLSSGDHYHWSHQYDYRIILSEHDRLTVQYIVTLYTLMKIKRGDFYSYERGKKLTTKKTLRSIRNTKPHLEDQLNMIKDSLIGQIQQWYDGIDFAILRGIREEDFNNYNGNLQEKIIHGTKDTSHRDLDKFSKQINVKRGLWEEIMEEHIKTELDAIDFILGANRSFDVNELKKQIEQRISDKVAIFWTILIKKSYASIHGSLKKKTFQQIYEDIKEAWINHVKAILTLAYGMDKKRRIYSKTIRSSFRLIQQNLFTRIAFW
jgi:hypothetical protein